MNVICDYCDITGKVGTDCVHCGQPLTELVEPPHQATGPVLLRRLEKLANAYPATAVDLDAAYQRSRILWVLETVGIGTLALLVVLDPPAFGAMVGLTVGVFLVGANLIRRRGTWLGAAAVLARSRPEMGLNWLAELPAIKQHIKRLALVGSFQLLIFLLVLIQLFQNGFVEPEVFLVWLAAGLILVASRVLGDMQGYSAVRQHLAATIS